MRPRTNSVATCWLTFLIGCGGATTGGSSSSDASLDVGDATSSALDAYLDESARGDDSSANDAIEGGACPVDKPVVGHACTSAGLKCDYKPGKCPDGSDPFGMVTMECDSSKWKLLFDVACIGADSGTRDSGGSVGASCDPGFTDSCGPGLTCCLTCCGPYIPGDSGPISAYTCLSVAAGKCPPPPP